MSDGLVIRSHEKLIFLSYAGGNKNAAVQLKEEIQNLGFVVFLDKENIKEGNLKSKIVEAINECSALVVLDTPDAKKSSWVNFEIGLATALDKVIIPIQVEGKKENRLDTIQELYSHSTAGDVIKYLGSEDFILKVQNKENHRLYNHSKLYTEWWDLQNSLRSSTTIFFGGYKLEVDQRVFSPDVRLTYSTQMAYNYIMTHPPIGKRVLDVGTGTGILAIVSAKNKALSVTAIDPDEDAIRNAERNIAQLKLKQKVKLLNSTISEVNDKYDLVIANLPISAEAKFWGGLQGTVEDIIKEFILNINRVLSDDGILVLSWASFGPKQLIPRALQEAGYNCRHQREDTFGATWFLYEGRRKQL